MKKNVPAQGLAWNCFIKPRVALIFVLIGVWILKNGNSANANHQQASHGNLRLRAPSQLAPSPSQLIAEMQETLRPGPGHGPGSSDLSEESDFIGGGGTFGGIGNVEPVSSQVQTRKKKNCGVSAIAARGIVGPSLKRSYFANTREEVDEKIQEELRQKRDIHGHTMKRNELTEGPLPWTCLTKYEWEDMGADHYPRFVRTAECKSRVCFNGFFRCKPRRYKTKVLKRISGSETTSCEEDDVSLPETLRTNWRFITVTINLCCDCTGRIPGTET